MRRLVIESDHHNNHRTGLIPPDWQKGSKKWRAHQRELWNWRKARIKELQPIDFYVLNGDASDGLGQRSGGTELITTELNEIAEIGAFNIDSVGASEYGIINGTGYHCAFGGSDIEPLIASKTKTPCAFVSGQEFLEYRGVTFDFKHTVGGSSIPHGKFTAVAKEKLWNLLWSVREQQPNADVIIRSHVHRFAYCGEKDWLAITTPGLQSFGSKYGVRQCSGTIDIGLLVFEIEDGEYSWRPILADLKQQVARVTKR